MITRKEQLKALADYLSTRNDISDWSINHDLGLVNFSPEAAKIANVFLAAIQIGYKTHVRKTNEHLAENNKTLREVKARTEKVENNLQECKKEAANNYRRGRTDGYIVAKSEYQQQYQSLEKVAKEGINAAFEKGRLSGLQENVNIKIQQGLAPIKENACNKELLREAYEKLRKKENECAGLKLAFDNLYKDVNNCGFIPTNAYDIEVFSIQPSNDFTSGQQAFIGYKIDVNGEPQFRFNQLPFTGTNPNKKYGTN